MKLKPIYVGKVTRREDKQSQGGKQYVSLTMPFDGASKGDDGKPLTIWVKTNVFPDRNTGELPRVLEYIQQGTVVGVEGDLDVREYSDKNGVNHTSVEISFPRFHLLPRNTADQAPAAAHDEEEPDPFADEA